MGVLLLVAVIIGAVAGGPAGAIAGKVSHLLGCIGAGGCETTSGTGAPATGAQTTGATPSPGPVAAAAGDPQSQPTPAPEPGPAPAAAWPGQAANLPQGGERPYVPPKSSRGQPKKVPAGRRGGARGYEDADGNIWVWNPPGSPTAHGGPHWDVEHKDGSHTNVNPDGSVRGPDNFPNRPRGDSGSDSSGGDEGISRAEAAGAAAAGIGVGALIWWGAKVLSPACGPFAPVCAVVL
ncbi:MAG: hypothetical protein ABWZ67_04130 [Solirubrobacteraceae bacterium]